MTDKQKMDYLSNNGVKCPYCGNEELATETLECLKMWQDYLKIFAVEPI